MSELTDREIDIECYHNLYKSLYGHRPRHIDFDAMTDNEITTAINDLAIEPTVKPEPNPQPNKPFASLAHLLTETINRR